MADGSGRVSVLLFAGLRERAGTGRVEVEVEAGATVADVAASVKRLWPALSSCLDGVAVAVNHEYVSRAYPVKSGDEVALISPVSGG